jgi:hypothetical protein
MSDTAGDYQAIDAASTSGLEHLFEQDANYAAGYKDQLIKELLP